MSKNQSKFQNISFLLVDIQIWIDFYKHWNDEKNSLFKLGTSLENVTKGCQEFAQIYDLLTRNDKLSVSEKNELYTKKLKKLLKTVDPVELLG